MIAALLVVACTGSGPDAPSVELTVYAAASLGPALEEARAAYEATNPGTTLVLSTDSSAALRAKIEQGAPADLFLSADSTNPDALVDAGLTDGDAVTFASNVLAIVVPTDNPAGIETPADLATDGVRIVAAGDEVPITRYAARLVDRLGALPGYPPDFVDRYAASVLSREDNVQAVVAKIALGEGDAGIVYATDARAAGDVATVEIPPEANVETTYAGVVLEASPRVAEGRAFLDWLAGSGGRATLAEFGFGPAP